MEFLTGEDLRGAIDNGRTGDLKHKLRIALQAARALGFVHTKNIVHRDIKPDNLHIDESGRVRLMDFGIAKAQNLNITREGFAVGTPYYMAPEQVLGKPVTPAADVYSFAILLYELLTGIKPVVGETVESLFYLILHEPLNLEPLQKAGTPPELIRLITQWTAKKPEERTSSFDTVIAGLESVLSSLEGTGRQSEPVPPPPPPPPPIKKSNLPLIAGGAAVVVALVIAAVILIPKKDDDGKKDPEKKQTSGETKGPPSRIQDDFGEMILIPAGMFVSGTDAQTQTKNLPAFYIDKTEISVEAWNKFAKATNKTASDSPGNLPIAQVQYAEAIQYCTWAQKRLPTGDEWEKAARGSDGRVYPWGHEPDATRANVRGNPSLPKDTLQPVDSLPQGATPLGVLHMAGNVWEWVRDPRKPSPEILQLYKKYKVRDDEPWTSIRGGGIDFDVRGAVAHQYQTYPESLTTKAIGFRCVKDAPAP
jgi:formylglycine-generating enzyme required for sulfatase activity